MESNETMGELLIRGMEEALAHARGEISALTHVRSTTSREVRVDAPPLYRSEEIRAVRTRLAVSQSVFAAALGVSVGTVSAWERGTRLPAGPARRLLEVASEHPEALLDKIHTSSVRQSA